MRNWNPNEFDRQSLALQRFLEKAAQEVIPTLPAPYGTFEKAKYEIRKLIKKSKGSKWIERQPIFFTTTCHNTEDAFEIIKRQAPFFKPYYMITKTVNGVEEILYATPRR